MNWASGAGRSGGAVIVVLGGSGARGYGSEATST